MTAALLTQAIVDLFLVVLRMSWHATVVMLLVVLVQWILGRRLSAAWRHALWAIVLLRLIVPFVPEGRFSIFNRAEMLGATAAVSSQREKVPSRSLQDRKSDVPVRPAPVTQAVSDEIQSNESTFGSRRLLVAAACGWLFGIALLAVRTIVTALRLSREISRLPKATDPRLRDVLDECCRQLGMSRAPELVVAPHGSEAGVAGLSRTRIIIPQDLVTTLSSSGISHIVLHELVHIRRCDLLWNWLALIVCHVHWFNPLVWLASRQARLDAELACDAETLANLRPNERSGYGETLLRLLEQAPAITQMRPALKILGHRNTLRRRIRMIARYEGISFQRTLLGLSAGAMLCLIGLTQAVSSSPPTDELPGPSLQEPDPASSDAGSTNVRSSAAAIVVEPPPVDALQEAKKSAARWLGGRDFRGVADIRRLEGENPRAVLLHGPRINDSDLATLAEHPELDELAIHDTSIRGPGLKHLSSLPKLTKLVFLGAQCTDALLDALPDLPRLKSLTLVGCATSDQGLKVLARFTQLDSLELRLVPADKGLEHLSRVPSLTRLTLDQTHLSDVGLQHLAAVPKLKLLTLDGPAEISDDGLSVLQHLRDLESFYSTGLVARGEGLAHLSAATNLKLLSLVGQGVNDAWLRGLAPLRNVEWLQLHSTQITGAGLTAIRNWSKMKTAYLEFNEIDDAGIEHLAELYRLRNLMIGHNHISEGAFQKLREALPDTSMSNQR